MTYSPADYRPCKARHNAEVFKSLWRNEVVGVEDDGLFYTDNSGGGLMQASQLAEEIRDTDIGRRLSMADCIDAAGQLLRATPPMFYPGEMDQEEGTEVHPSWFE